MHQPSTKANANHHEMQYYSHASMNRESKRKKSKRCETMKKIAFLIGFELRAHRIEKVAEAERLIVSTIVSS